MKRAVCLQHVPFEGPRAFGASLVARDYAVESRLVPTEGLPDDPGDFLLLMGGPMSVNDDQPWLRAECDFVARVLASDIPVLGICLGSQIMMRAMGGSVRPGPKPEIGRIALEAGPGREEDLLFADFPDPWEVIGWHGEGLHPPEDGPAPLFCSADYEMQAFRVRPLAYGMLFHTEMTEPGIRALCRHCPGDVEASGLDADGLVVACRDLLPALHRQSDLLIDRMTA